MPSNENPSFFKVLVDMDFKKLLRLPPCFLRRYDLCLRENVKLKVDDSGRSWTVKVELLNNGLFCFTKKDWPKFVEDAGLQLGEFLVFSLLPRSEFNVVIYETSFSQREILTPSSSLAESNAHDVEVESKGMDGNASGGIKRKSGRPRQSKRGNPLPYFEAVMKDHHRSRISLPRKFLVASNMKERKQVKMAYVGNRRCVSVVVDPRPPSNRIDLAKGWPKFREANLRNGKWYRFEFNPDNLVIYVRPSSPK